MLISSEVYEARSYGRIGMAKTIALTFLITAPWWALLLASIGVLFEWAHTGEPLDIELLQRFAWLLPISTLSYVALRWFGRRGD